MYGVVILPFLTGLCYSLVAPLIVPLVALTMCGAYVTLKYQIFYVYETKNESHGIWWPRVFNLACIILALFQFTTFGSLVVKAAQVKVPGKSDGRLPNLIVILLPILTFIFWVYCTSHLKPQSEYSNELDAVAAPKRDERFNNAVLSDRVYNPAVVKLLPKVWIKKEMSPYLDVYYKPEFTDVLDFVAKTDPARLEETQEKERTRNATRRITLTQRPKSTLEPVTVEDPLSAYNEPPELAGIQQDFSDANVWQPNVAFLDNQYQGYSSNASYQNIHRPREGSNISYQRENSSNVSYQQRDDTSVVSNQSRREPSSTSYNQQMGYYGYGRSDSGVLQGRGRTGSNQGYQ